jgi:glycosyltransferase involved in cell wall biosynthesis
MRKMRIALEDGLATQKRAGIGRYTLNLFRLLNYCPQVDEVWLLKKPSFFKLLSPRFQRIFYIIWINSKMQLFLNQKKIDIVHFTNYLIPYLKLSRTKYVVTIHDLVAWRYPDTLPRSYVPYIRCTLSNAIKNADLVLTVSNTMKEEITSRFDNSFKVRVAYNVTNNQFWKVPKFLADNTGALKIKRQFGINKDFFIFVGTLEARKNLLTAIRALENIKKDLRPQLILVGRPGFRFSALNDYIREKRLEKDVIITGHLPDDKLIMLYDLALGLIYPSIYEGFGIPLLEAMIRGTPIIASKIPSTEEVAGDVALYYSENALDFKALAHEMVKLIENKELKRILTKKGIERAQYFSDEKICKQYIEAYLSLF